MSDEATHLRAGRPTSGDARAENPSTPDVTGGAEVTPEAPERYQVTAEELGRGGIGRVYVAFDRHLGRPVAVKELLSGDVPATPQSEEDRTRFLREARVTGQLEHPSIVPVYELGRRPDGTLYYAMKLVRGQTLRDELDPARDLASRLSLLTHFRDLANAIAYAHSQGVVHRDIKPDNVMVGEFGQTVVLDWGLTKVRGEEDFIFQTYGPRVRLPEDSSDSNTRAGMILGTPAYMSPEQARGEVEQIDERSDVWSLGAVLYELLTGNPPFGRRPATQVLFAVAEGRIEPVLTVQPQAPPDLAAIADKALSRSREDRYSSAKEMAADLEAFMSGRRVGAYDYTAWELARKFVRENQAVAASLAAVTVAILVGSVSTFWAYQQAVSERERALEAERSALQARRESEDARRESNRHLSEALVEQSWLRNRSRDLGPAGLYAAAALFHSPWVESSPFRYPDLKSPPNEEQARALLPLHSSLYTAWVKNRVDVDWFISNEETCTLSTTGQNLHVAFKDGSLRTYDLDRRLQTGRRDIGACPDIMDARHGQVAYAEAQGPLRHMDAEGRTRTFLPTDLSPRGLAFVPGGQSLLAAFGDGKVVRLTVPDGRTQARTDIRGQPKSLRLSPDGRQLLVGTRWGTVVLLDAETLRELARHEDHSSSVWALAFGPAPDVFASAGFEGRIVVRQGGKSVQLLQSDEPVKGLAFDGGGGQLVSGGFGPARLWDLASGRLLQVFDRNPRGILSVAEASAGRVVSLDAGAGFTVWKIEGSGLGRALLGHQGPVWSVATVGQDVVSLDAGGSIRWWDGVNESLRWKANERMLWGAAGSAQEKAVYTITSRGKVQRWTVDGSARTLQGTLPTWSKSSIGLGGSDPWYAWSGPPGSVVLYRNDSQRVEGRLDGGVEGQVTAVAVSPQGWVAAADDQGTLALWDAESRRRLWRVAKAHQGAITGLVAWPGRNAWVSSGQDGQIRIWSGQDGALLDTWSGHQDWVNRLAISPDGRWLVSTSDDGSVRLWDTRQGLARLQIPAETQVAGAIFSPAGDRFWVGLDDTVWGLPTTLRALQWPADKLMADARERTGRTVNGFRLQPLSTPSD